MLLSGWCVVLRFLLARGVVKIAETSNNDCGDENEVVIDSTPRVARSKPTTMSFKKLSVFTAHKSASHRTRAQ
jgi:hypothetical protein